MRVSSVIVGEGDEYEIVQSLPLVNLNMTDSGCYIGGAEVYMSGNLDVTGILFEFGAPSEVGAVQHLTMRRIGSDFMACIGLLDSAFDEMYPEVEVSSIEDPSDSFNLVINVSNV